MKLSGKTAVVTGAGSGIGAAIAACFAREGARVVSAGRTADKLEKARQQAGDAAERIFPYAADVSDAASVQKLFDWAGEKIGGAGILVNCAGINVAKRAMKDLSPEDFQKVVDINLTGAFLCIRAALPKMRERGEGLIINVSSIAGVRASVLGGVGYSASKFGMSGLSLTVGAEEGRNGIRSCMICPGEVNTPILDQRPVVPGPEQRAKMLQPEDLAQAALLMATLDPRATIPELIITPSIYQYS
jgi:NAD(P)-dependent dehydrogenase (short-subunit alcohol dehydrogenase family)